MRVGLRPAWRRGDGRWLALVLAVSVLAYGTACAGDFVYDDLHSVRDNTAIRSLAEVPRLFVDLDAFSALDNRMYRPVLLVTFALDHALGGLQPLVYKLTNLLLHALTACLLFGLGRRFGLARPAAAAGACFAAAHPLASEAVNMISGRSEVLMVAALLVGLHTHAAALRGRRLAVAGTALAAGVACGSKETGVILPVLLVGLEVLVAVRSGRRPGWRELRAAALRIAPALGVVVLYLVVRKVLFGTATVAVPTLHGGRDPSTGAGRDLVTQLATMATLLPRVLGQMLVPIGLSIDPPVSFTDRVASWPVLGGAALVLGASALALARPRRQPLLCLGLALAWGTALPWILIPLNVPLSEHRLYGPVVGCGLLAAALLRRPLARPRPAALLAVALPLALLAAGSAQRSLAYRDEKVLWERALLANPASYRAYYSIGVCRMRAGDLIGARAAMERALELYPDYVSAQKNVAEIELQLGDAGDPARAATLARSLVQREGRNPFYRLLLSRALAAVAARRGTDALFDQAVEMALSVLDVAPPRGLVFRTAAHARRQQGRPEAALELLDESLHRGLDHASVRLDRAEVLLDLGRPAQAEAEVTRVLQRDPFEPRAIGLLQRLRAEPPR